MSVELSPLEWLMPRTYVSQILCFPSTDPHIFASLKHGLQKTVEDVPYLFAGVVDREHPNGAVQLTAPYQTLDDLLSRVDLSDSLRYPDLRSRCFPPSALILPELKPPETVPPYPAKEPVFRARLALIKGGALLTIAVHHCTTDITGFGALLRLWALNCENNSVGDFGLACFDRRPLWRSTELVSSKEAVVPELIHIKRSSVTSHSTVDKVVKETPAPDFTTCIFGFPQEALQVLKRQVNTQLAAMHTEVSWVSTSDILTSLLWSAIIWTDQDQPAAISGDDTGVFSTVGFPVNFRARYEPPLSKAYLGAAFAMSTASVPRTDLLALSAERSTTSSLALIPTPSDEDVGKDLDADSLAHLARVAAAVRRSINNLAPSDIRAALSYVASQPDIRDIKLGPAHDGVSLVSWADQEVYALHWGRALGRCEAVRVPQFRGRRNPIVLPLKRHAEGQERVEFEVVLSLERDAMRRFAESRLIKRFGRLRCGEELGV